MVRFLRDRASCPSACTCCSRDGGVDQSQRLNPSSLAPVTPSGINNELRESHIAAQEIIKCVSPRHPRAPRQIHARQSRTRRGHILHPPVREQQAAGHLSGSVNKPTHQSGCITRKGFDSIRGSKRRGAGTLPVHFARLD